MRSSSRTCLLALWLLIGTAATGAAQPGWYGRAGLGVDWTSSTRFEDLNCAATDPPALFGCGAGIDGRPLGAYGDFGSAWSIEAGFGREFLPGLRAELLLTYRPDLDFRGDANFLGTPGPQPVLGAAESLTGMLAGYLDLAVLGLPDLGPLRPFVGAGLGISRNEIDAMRYEFPGLQNHRATLVKGGREMDFAFMLTAGTAIALTERVTLDIAYRYSDLGEVNTDAGPATLVLARGDTELDIAGTRADLTMHGVSASLRFGF